MEHTKSVGSDQILDGFPMDFEAYTRDELFRPGQYVGIILFAKEKETKSGDAALSVVLGLSDNRTDPARGARLRCDVMLKNGTSWLTNYMEVVDPEHVGKRFDPRAHRGKIVLVEVDVETWDGKDRNKVTRFLKARTASKIERASGGRRDERQDDRNPYARDDQPRRHERDDRGRDDDRGYSRDDRREQDDRRERDTRRESSRRDDDLPF